MKVCPECGCDEFSTDAIEHWTWIVDGDGHYIDQLDLHDAKIGENEWYCRECRAEFAGPHELKEIPDAPES